MKCLVIECQLNINGILKREMSGYLKQQAALVAVEPPFTALTGHRHDNTPSWSSIKREDGEELLILREIAAIVLQHADALPIWTSNGKAIALLPFNVQYLLANNSMIMWVDSGSCIIARGNCHRNAMEMAVEGIVVDDNLFDTSSAKAIIASGTDFPVCFSTKEELLTIA